jgi:hypothetical protein
MLIPLTPAQLAECLESVERSGDDMFASDHFEAIRNHITHLTTLLATAEKLYKVLRAEVEAGRAMVLPLKPDQNAIVILDIYKRARAATDAAMKEAGQ